MLINDFVYGGNDAEHVCNRLQSELQHLRETSGAPTRTEEAAAERYEELSKKK